MNIMVFDVPADRGGALTILQQYYEKAIADKTNKWIFVVSTPKFAETENVQVLRYPWIKSSWVHRLFFDTLMAAKIIKRYQVDEVLSLQNLTIRGTKVKQTLYLHQPLPFVEKRYRITENFRFWVYQNIIGKMIFNSIRRADAVIVQTNWMKTACLKRTSVTPSKFIVVQPKINVEVVRTYEKDCEAGTLFFYPASAASYKNHIIIIKAAELLRLRAIRDYKIIFTLKGNETRSIKRLYAEVGFKNLPIEFIGEITLAETYDYYSKSILIFPSFIETFGLPMLEAKMHGSPILASNCAFSHEILDDYDNKAFFNPFNQTELADLMQSTLIKAKS